MNGGEMGLQLKWVSLGVREPKLREVVELPDGADFLGFCDPCGGFRRHKRGCPISVRQGMWISLEDAQRAWGVFGGP